MVSRIGRQFGRWRVCEKMESLGIVESIGLLVLILLMVPFPHLDILVAPAGYTYIGSLFVALLLSFVENIPPEARDN
jgi:hypothetical protein